MAIVYAEDLDLEYLTRRDHHISEPMMRAKIERREVLIARIESQPVGWLRFGYWWDEIPFMNMLFVDEPSRGKGFGRQLIDFWEAEMCKQGYERVMTSTLSSEQAQHLYRKLGYVDCGALLLPGEALEILFVKQLT